MNNKREEKRIQKIFEMLRKKYPDTKPALNFSNPLELLVATILSAQCTDERVNLVTKELFKNYKKAEDYANANPKILEREIYSTGFYKQKTKSLIGCCKKLVEKHSSKVPANFEALTKLPGVGRKTASVVAANIFGIPAIAVDTHVKRLTNLLGIVDTKDVVKIEFKLKKLLPEKDWGNSTHWFIAHGRKICIARRPKCNECFLKNYCPNAK